MLHVDIPTPEEFLLLADVRSDACVTIYLQTSPLREELDASRIQFSNAIKEALQQLSAVGFDKRRLVLLEDELYGILEDEGFWRLHAYSLAVLATPDNVRTYRLANSISSHVEVADRFYLKPLLRALTFTHSAYVLALSENEVRLIEFFTEGPAQEVSVPDLPESAAEAVNISSFRTRSFGGRLQGDEGKKVRFAQFTQKVDRALRPLFAANNYPLILVATEPLASIYRSTNSLSNLVGETISTNSEHIGVSDLAKLARPVLDKFYAQQLDNLKGLFEQRAGQRRVTTDLSDAARAATFGAVELLMVDMDAVVPGVVDDEGKVTFHNEGSAVSYGVVDEIAKRALATGARVLSVRKDDLPGQGNLAAVLRYPL